MIEIYVAITLNHYAHHHKFSKIISSKITYLIYHACELFLHSLLGAYIRLKEQKWCVAIEISIGYSTLCGFVVTSHDDEYKLKGIIRDVCKKHHSNFTPPVFTSSFTVSSLCLFIIIFSHSGKILQCVLQCKSYYTNQATFISRFSTFCLTPFYLWGYVLSKLILLL